LSVDDLVAPIALYPDQLLGQVLTAATSPQQVLDGGNWLIQNQTLKGDVLTDAAKQAGFGPPMQYLMNFPQVVDNMCQQMDWTTQLGEAFTSDPKGVMAAIQRKRSDAQQVGNLTSSPQMTVATKTENGQQYVEIKPTDPKVVYVPQYNPVTIYNNPAPAAPAPATTATNTATTTEEKKSGVSTGAAVGLTVVARTAWQLATRSAITMITIRIHRGVMAECTEVDLIILRHTARCTGYRPRLTTSPANYQWISTAMSTSM
jgi:hypothetical protein